MKRRQAEEVAEGAGPASRIEVQLSPEYSRKCIGIGLRRTRKRAAKLLADLLKAIEEPDPDIERLKELAEGIRFESELGRSLLQTSAAVEDGSDVGLGWTF